MTDNNLSKKPVDHHTVWNEIFFILRILAIPCLILFAVWGSMGSLRLPFPETLFYLSASVLILKHLVYPKK
jgi:hypothetical protein